MEVKIRGRERKEEGERDKTLPNDTKIALQLVKHSPKTS